jgi:site-specific DNA recombinase
MNTKQVALYARVSSEQQAEAKTIESQLAEIRARITADGFEQNSVLEFVDEGYSGSTLVRPALERLRDVAVLPLSVVDNSAFSPTCLTISLNPAFATL